MATLLDAAWRAAELIAQADGLVIAAGAGMGVDSGLPDFRSDAGFWQAYPALKHIGLNFADIATPQTFVSEPALAWGFYGHRLALYRRTLPHAGFAMLRQIADRLPRRGFVFTSNVDGHFQKASFASSGVVEIHGSIHHLQCSQRCTQEIWSAERIEPVVDAAHCLLRSPLPRCPRCGAVARPNILMFWDDHWLSARTDAQHRDYLAWREQLKRPVVIELGAGTRVRTVRNFSERQGCPVIRINPAESVLHGMHVGIAGGALEGLGEIVECLRQMAFLPAEPVGLRG